MLLLFFFFVKKPSSPAILPKGRQALGYTRNPVKVFREAYLHLQKRPRQVFTAGSCLAPAIPLGGDSACAFPPRSRDRMCLDVKQNLGDTTEHSGSAQFGTVQSCDAGTSGNCTITDHQH